MLHTNGKSSLHVIFSTDSTSYIHGLFKRIKKHIVLLISDLKSETTKNPCCPNHPVWPGMNEHMPGHVLPVPGRGHFSQCGPQALPTLQQQSCLVRCTDRGCIHCLPELTSR